MTEPAFVLLAAGRGARMGGGKLTAELHGQPLWRWAARAAELAGFAERCIVTNDAEIGAQAQATEWQVAANAQAAEGIAASLRIAAALPRADMRLVIALADMPFVAPAHLTALAAAPATVFTAWPGGKRGIPAAFTPQDRARLARLAGDRGAAALDWPGASVVAPGSPDELLDVDTQADLARARERTLRR